MTRNNFTCKIVTELIEDDFSVLIKHDKRIAGCAGWFDGSRKEFVIAMKNKLAFEVMVHEYSHYRQWKDTKRYFNKLSKGCDIFFDWLDGTFYTKAVVQGALSDVIELEWDCECRALELIKTYKLDIDVNEYCKAANAYLMYYHMVHDQRIWLKDRSPYSRAICKRMESCLHPLDYYLNRDNITASQEREYLKAFEK